MADQAALDARVPTASFSLMVFKRLFGKTPREPERDPDADAQERDDTAGPGNASMDDGEDDGAKSRAENGDADPSWAERATALIPTGASTGSKRAEAMYGNAASSAPTHYRGADGCHLETTEGDTLLDCTMALGAVALGYADANVTRAAVDAIANGHVAGLSHALEVELAERFCNVVPCAEKVQFLKSGAEGVAAAVRLARAATGRDAVVGCGYFGWHDWCSDAPGVPKAVQALYQRIPFDDIPALERAVSAAGTALAAIVIEPVVERLPSAEWIARARALADSSGAVLIFDEMKTGFRIATGGYQEYGKVVPDLAVFGKALANGFPLAAVCGRSAIMDAARTTWISSTLAGEASALAAALQVIGMHQDEPVCEKLWSIGKEMRIAVTKALHASGLNGITIEGIDPMWFLRFDSPERETAFLESAVRHGVLFKRGPYNFPSLAHDEDAIAEIEFAASHAFVELRENEAHA